MLKLNIEKSLTHLTCTPGVAVVKSNFEAFADASSSVKNVDQLSKSLYIDLRPWRQAAPL